MPPSLVDAIAPIIVMIGAASATLVLIKMRYTQLVELELVVAAGGGSRRHRR